MSEAIAALIADLYSIIQGLRGELADRDARIRQLEQQNEAG